MIIIIKIVHKRKPYNIIYNTVSEVRAKVRAAKIFPSACCTAHAIAVTTVTALVCV